MRTVLLFLVISHAHITFGQYQISGFQASQLKDQLELEAQFSSSLNADNLDLWMRKLAAKPHHVGSEYGQENAEFMAKKFKSWGFDTEIETYYVLFPTPKIRSLQILGPEPFKAALIETPLDVDSATRQTVQQLPPYNAYSTDGDVTAELVFVNYGVPADYEELEKRGIDVKGKIVIAKYFGSWRGIKPKVAAEKGAIGCIIYSDPKEDGYYQGEEYPQGAFKNATGVQRGSVMDMPLYPGDPLTPGYAATRDANRLEVSEAPTLTDIPVLPISYQDALPLLNALQGPVAPAAWRGALPLTYRLGPGPVTVQLKVEFNWDIKPAHNVIAKLKGHQYPDQWIMRGNHHDAWVNGANDPISGMVSLMEEARAVGSLVKNGWKPKRTIVYCAWDAEEPGLIGSTEWVEDHESELKEKVVVYINTDSNGRGFLSAGGSHTLESFMEEITYAVQDPQKEVSVGQRRKAMEQINGNHDNSQGFTLYALGSGSDYSPFIQHAGIASLNLGYGGESSGGEYHTMYDTYRHYTMYKDPGFKYGVTLAETCGKAVLRLSNAQVLPFEFSRLYNTLSKYLDEVVMLSDEVRNQVEVHNQLLAENAFFLAADPADPFTKPDIREAVPYLNFAPLQNALQQLKRISDQYTPSDGYQLNRDQLLQLNQLLYQSERKLTDATGLPRRPWYRHMIYAPGFYTGYGVKTLPGVREAIEEELWSEAQSEILQLAETINEFNQHLIGIREVVSAP